MKLSDVTNEEIKGLRDQYALDLFHETQASLSVKRMWKVTILALDEILARRFNGGARTVLDATKMVMPGDEPLARRRKRSS
jgi:hypothetical protein